MKSARTKNKKTPKGFTLIEALVGLGILSIILAAVLSMYYSNLQALGIARARLTASSLASEEIEIIENLPYADVGTTTGWPLGVLPSSRQVNRNGLTFTVSVYPKYVDDPFDGDAFGTVAGKPTDTQPSDYKFVEVRVCWSHYPCNTPVSLSTQIVPNGVETDDGTGSLFIEVLNAQGQAVGQADVNVVNTTTVPVINISSSTGTNGRLLLSSLPPALDSYQITVSKTGHNSDYTVTPSVANPNPTRPDTSIIAGDVTESTFFLDHTANLELYTVDDTCTAVSNVQLNLRGAWLDGTSPDVYRYDQAHTTDALGHLSLSDLQWDYYTQLIDPSEGLDVAGTTISQPYNVLPSSNQTVYVHLVPDSANTLLITVREAGTATPLSDASVHVEDGVDFDETKTTGQGTLTQSDWSGGSGQADYSDETMYFSQDGNIDDTNAGDITLVQDPGNGNFSEDFTTDVYKDPVTSTANWDTVSNRGELSFDLGNYQSPGTLASLQLNSEEGIITSATLTVTEELNSQSISYELSADGGAHFEAVTPGINHTFSTQGTDLRWRATLSTTNTSVTPRILDLSLSYNYLAYRVSGTLISSTFNFGPDSAFDNIIWAPLAQPSEVGSTSVKFQIATNTDNATWNYVGPDGTAGTYYTTSGDSLWSGHTGDQYLRYQVILSTANQSASPTLSSISLVHSAGCIPPGQVFFSSLDPDTYQITVDRSGYQQFLSSVDVSGDTVYYVDLDPS
ncbi:MAG: type II secretion system protein [Candidatus Nomurabacteria bacterium]|nr:MAG: type II secretion system protein [Candidatus Nomurabacteria bacterium]